MNCACRTKSLRIFVQSLTELRVTDPIISRSVRLIRPGPPLAFRQAPTRHPARLFSSSTVFSSGQKLEDSVDASSADQAAEKPSPTSIGTTADTTNNESPSLIPSASGSDFTAAKLNGAILDYSPESIDTLVASLDRTTFTSQESAFDEHDIPNSNVRFESRPPKQPITTSQLKRRKILKEEKPEPSAEGSQAPQKEHWKIQKAALKEKFPEGWRPRKRLSPDALDGIRALHAQFPEQYTTEVLARNFEVSPEAVRRILKSKWTPSPEEEIRRQERWFNRGKNIWSQMAELGKKPPRKWRREGVVRKPHWNEKKGPRTEYPYVPRREPRDESRDESSDPVENVESAHRKLSGNLL
ncbi:hypothetical protein F5Y09DRAFT_318430 [Xylaria sp. FL1042]|nr:hypothetical protein F5Y09DRAFT_318430 [Xylaria sp. FL1042]